MEELPETWPRIKGIVVFHAAFRVCANGIAEYFERRAAYQCSEYAFYRLSAMIRMAHDFIVPDDSKLPLFVAIFGLLTCVKHLRFLQQNNVGAGHALARIPSPAQAEVFQNAHGYGATAVAIERVMELGFRRLEQAGSGRNIDEFELGKRLE